MKKVFTLVMAFLLTALLPYAASASDTVKSAPASGDKTYIFIIAAAVALAGLIFIMIWRSNKNKSDGE